MAKLVFDAIDARYYETGISECALYVGSTAAAWSGITSVTESPSGAEANPVYADNIKYLNLISNEDFGVTIEALMYPDEFAPCNGETFIVDGVYASQQKREPFNLTYKTKVGNYSDPEAGFKYHFVYGCNAAPTSSQYSSTNESPETATFSWEVTTTPISFWGDLSEANKTAIKNKMTSKGITVPANDFGMISHFEIDTTTMATSTKAAAIARLEDAIYGTSSKSGKMLCPAEAYALIENVTLS